MDFKLFFRIQNLFKYRRRIFGHLSVRIVDQVWIHRRSSVFPLIKHLPLTFVGKTQISNPITVIDFIMKVTWTNWKLSVTNLSFIVDNYYKKRIMILIIWFVHLYLNKKMRWWNITLPIVSIIYLLTLYFQFRTPWLKLIKLS